jgi:hypothetical protein
MRNIVRYLMPKRRRLAAKDAQVLEANTQAMTGEEEDPHELTREEKKEFLMFTRVLLKYLERKDPIVKHMVKEIIRDCIDRNKRQEPGYESVTTVMRDRLRAAVHEDYWKRAESYLRRKVKDVRLSRMTPPAEITAVLVNTDSSDMSLLI